MASLLGALADLAALLWRGLRGPDLLRAVRDVVGNTLAPLMPSLAGMIMPRLSSAYAKFNLDPTKAWELEVDGAKQKPKELSIACLWDIAIKSAQPLDTPLEKLLRDKLSVLSPYSYELEKDCVVLIETKAGLDVSKEPSFFYQAQVANAIRAYLIPTSDFISAVEAVHKAAGADFLKRTALLHSTGRCGSTLLSKILDSFGQSDSFNEPDIYTCLMVQIARDRSPGGKAQVASVARAATLMLVAGKLAQYPEEQANKMMVWIKFRSGVVGYADLLKSYMPETKAVYLYRNAIDYTDSACSGFTKSGPFPFFRKVGLDGFLVWKSKPHKFSNGPMGMGGSEWGEYVTAKIKDIPENYKTAFDIGFVAALALMWQENVWQAECHTRNGIFDAILRYEELVQHREVLVKKMLQCCGFDGQKREGVEGAVDTAIATDVDRVFQEDAHKGSMLQSSRVDAKGNRIKEPVYIKTWEMDSLLRVLAVHPTVGDPYVLLPGTLMTAAEE